MLRMVPHAFISFNLTNTSLNRKHFNHTTSCIFSTIIITTPTICSPHHPRSTTTTSPSPQPIRITTNTSFNLISIISCPSFQFTLSYLNVPVTFFLIVLLVTKVSLTTSAFYHFHMFQL